MANYVLSCCSTADLSKEHFENRDIHYICFHYKLDGVDHPDDLGQTIPFEEFYKKMDEGADTVTSQVNVSEYVEYFSQFLEEGKDILHVSLSTGISGTYNSAMNAALIARERYPERKIYIVDSLGASSGYGLLMDKLADLRDSGMSIEEVRDWTEEHKLNLHHWFFSTDLSSYLRGGRISAASAIIGTALKICPLMTVDCDGKLSPREKIRTKKRAISEMAKTMMAHVQDGTNYSGKCIMSHSACREDAEAVAALVEQQIPQLKGKIEINDIGALIGSHTGPGTVALFFMGDKRVD